MAREEHRNALDYLIKQRQIKCIKLGVLKLICHHDTPCKLSFPIPTLFFPYYSIRHRISELTLIGLSRYLIRFFGSQYQVTEDLKKCRRRAVISRKDAISYHPLESRFSTMYYIKIHFTPHRKRV